MQELICFSAFLYQYIEFFVFLKVARRGAIAPPLNPPLRGYDYVSGFAKTVSNRARIEIQFILNICCCTILEQQVYGYRWPSVLSQLAFADHVKP